MTTEIKNSTEKISLRDISKTFSIGFRKRRGALERIRSAFSSREPKKTFEALDSVSFQASSGDIIGVIGSNGSGKSTLLRVMAGIYRPDKGSVRMTGKVVSIINLGVGLMERLPMRDNIFLIGALFGLDSKSVRQRFDSIVEFSGLEKFVDTKIYQFSAGMIQRLAFSIAIHADPDILLLDEVFEVGDEAFRKKSSDRIRQLAQGGCCVILVSHDMEIIEKNCTSIIELRRGSIIRRFLPQGHMRQTQQS